MVVLRPGAKLLTFVLSSGLLLGARSASAEPAVVPAAAEAPAAAPADGTRPASQGVSVTAPGGYACDLDDDAGMDAADARTSAGLVCDALAAHHARPGAYDVRVGKLGTKLLLTVSERQSGAARRLFIAGPEEVPLAAERVVSALVEDKPVAETQNVDNVVSSEVVTPLRKVAPLTVFVGATAAGALGFDNNTSAGVEGDIELRTQRIAVAVQGRAGGVSSGDNYLGYASVGAVGRYYLSDSETSLFVGAGPTLAYFQANEQNVLSEPGGLGFAVAAEVGAAFYRSSRAGLLVAVRADVPTFDLTSTNYAYGANGGTTTTTTWQYIVPVSVTFGLAFR
jgi:hypothetical protein